MLIRDMFYDDINRSINGVIKVDQDAADVTSQEVREYIITKELRKHFISFFNFYCEAFDKPTADIGVWISGFFGSGKSHFLKILSYLLENRPVDDTTVVELFRQKFADDPATFMLIDRATRASTEAILFNIDIEGSINKDKTAVLRVFAKMFYNHLGFYGENLKVAMLEKYIASCGKTEEFRRVFEQKKGKPWIEQRKAYAFNGSFIVPTLMEVLGMSEQDARSWFSDKSSVEFSIATLVSDIKEYVDSKPKDFRLLFMIDEVGQYVGTDTDMLLNLQSLTEKLGSECGCKVWVVCTGQEAIDEIIKVRSDEFSRIQARFKTRLSLSSSSVDEVIQKRILKKKVEEERKLESLYQENDSVLRNLFSFSDSRLDIKGYGGAAEFAIDFPFVPYQFIIMQKVFAEIRKHGNSGKHLSGGERSMLSGFQECAQKVQTRDEYTLVPFFRFYDTVHTFLDGSIRRVIERCQSAADTAAGIEQYDVDVLKLLYLIRYVDDIPANIDNIIILMADDIRADKITLRETVRDSLNRLLSQNYIGRTGDTYNFLTDEEQDIQREIRNTAVDTSSIVERIGQMLFGDIYTTKKYRYGKYDFDFEKMVDGVVVGAPTGGMRLKFLTIATDASQKSELSLMSSSIGQAIVVLSDSAYYESLESAMRIRKYVKQRNVNSLPPSIRTIIGEQQDEATAYEQSAMDELKKAIVSADYYVDGEKLSLTGSDTKGKIDAALEYLVSHVYSDLELIDTSMDSDENILSILAGNGARITGMPANSGAAAKIEEHLEMQYRKNLPTSMADIQSRYQAVPYGWKEIDIAGVMAQLIYDQKVTVKYMGSTIQPNNPRLVDMLRKKSEIGKTMVSTRQIVTAQKMNAVKDLLRNYFDVMDVPSDEDGLIAFIIEKFTKQREHYAGLEARYQGHKYPDHPLVLNAIQMIDDILSQQKDNIALVDRVLKRENDLLDSKEDMVSVEGFFKNQIAVFDSAVKLERDLANELDYLAKEPEANQALNQIRLIVSAKVDDAQYVYGHIPQLNDLIRTVHEGHDRLLAAKRDELLEIVRQCMEAIHTAAGINFKNIVSTADAFYTQKKQRISELTSLALLDGLTPPMLQQKDDALAKIEFESKPPVTPPPVTPVNPTPPATPKKIIKAFNRQIVFPAKQLESDADIDSYVEKIRVQLKALMQNCDGIKLN